MIEASVHGSGPSPHQTRQGDLARTLQASCRVLHGRPARREWVPPRVSPEEPRSQLRASTSTFLGPTTHGYGHDSQIGLTAPPWPPPRFRTTSVLPCWQPPSIPTRRAPPSMNDHRTALRPPRPTPPAHETTTASYTPESRWRTLQTGWHQLLPSPPAICSCLMLTDVLLVSVCLGRPSRNRGRP